MAERQKAKAPNPPSESEQASDRSKAEGERDTGREASGRDALRTGRGGLDPIEVRDVLNETSEKHRRGEDIGASGFSNPTLAEEQEEQAEVPPRNKTRKAGSGT